MLKKSLQGLLVSGLLLLFMSWEGCARYDKVYPILDENSAITTKHFSFFSPQGIWYQLESYQFEGSTLGQKCPDEPDGYCTYEITADPINPYAFSETEQFIDKTEDSGFISYITTRYYTNDATTLDIKTLQYFHRCVQVRRKSHSVRTSLYCPAQTDNGYKLIVSYYSALQDDINTSLHSIKATPIDLVYDYNNNY